MTIASCQNKMRTDGPAPSTDENEIAISESDDDIETDDDVKIMSAEERSSQEALNRKHIAFLKKFYDDFFVVGGTDWDVLNARYLPHVTKRIRQKLIDEYDYECEFGDCYAWWIFRDASQDSSEDIQVRMTGSEDGWINVSYKNFEEIQIQVHVEDAGGKPMITGLVNNDQNIEIY